MKKKRGEGDAKGESHMGERESTKKKEEKVMQMKKRDEKKGELTTSTSREEKTMQMEKTTG